MNEICWHEICAPSTIGALGAPGGRRVRPSPRYGPAYSFELIQKSLMRHGVKLLTKVEDMGVDLFALIDRSV